MCPPKEPWILVSMVAIAPEGGMILRGWHGLNWGPMQSPRFVGGSLSPISLRHLSKNFKIDFMEALRQGYRS